LSVEAKFLGMYFSALVQLEAPPHEKRNKDTIKILPKMIDLFITMIYRVCKIITMRACFYFIDII